MTPLVQANAIYRTAIPEVNQINGQAKRIDYVYGNLEYANQRANFSYRLVDRNADLLLNVLKTIEAPEEYMNKDLLQHALNFTPTSAHRETKSIKIELA